MQNLSWQEQVPSCFSSPDFIFGQGSKEVRSAKRMILDASRAAASQLDVRRELEDFLQRQACLPENIRKQLARFHAAWIWAEPIADQEVDHALDMVQASLDIVVGMIGELPIASDQSSPMFAQISVARKRLAFARFSHGILMTEGRAYLEVDPESGKEVYVVCPDDAKKDLEARSSKK